MTTIYTAEEVAKHNTKKDLWVSIHGEVYDLTPYLEDHPGGVPSLLEVAGQNATKAFEEINHTQDAVNFMKRLLIGKLDHDEEEEMPPKMERRLTPPQEPSTPFFAGPSGRYMLDMLATGVLVAASFTTTRRASRFTSANNWPIPKSLMTLLPWAVSTAVISGMVRRILKQVFPTPKEPPKRPAHFKVKSKVAPKKGFIQSVLDPRRYRDLPITSIEKLSSNTNKIVIDLPSPGAVLGLPIGQHISIRSVVDGTPVNRPYTPTSSNKDRGRLELVIKNYDDGLFTGKYLKDVQVGDKLSISGPKGQMRYRRGFAKNIGMIAGGTGITPMFQIIRAICEDKWDDTRITLLYANRTEHDILLKSELEMFVAEHSDQFKVHYLLSRPNKEWTGGVGRITQDLVKESLGPSDDKQNKVMICGPQGMVDDATQWMVALGYEPPHAVSKMADQVFIF